MGERKTKLAIIGTGLAGLAAGFEYLQTELIDYQIDFYRSTQHLAASQIASGLLHLFHGQQARIPPQAREALALSIELINQVDSDKESLYPISLIRPAKTNLQSSVFQSRARQHPQELDFGRVSIGNQTWNDALTIHQAWIVDTTTYLAKLEKFLQAKGCRFFETPLPERLLDNYELVIIAAGAQTLELMQKINGESLPSTLNTIITKGQLAHCHTAPPTVAINARAYVIPNLKNKTTILGATFERRFESIEPQECLERELIWQEGLQLWPELKHSRLQWLSGLRISGPDHLPFIGSYNGKIFVISGLGSKGLLYHRLMAQKLMRLIRYPLVSTRWEIFPMKTLIGSLIF